MKKQLIISGLIVILIIVGFSGCIEEKKGGQTETSDTINNLCYRSYGFGINPPGEIQTNKTTANWKTNWTMNETTYGVTFTLEDEDSVTLSVISRVGIVRMSGKLTEENGELISPKNNYEYEITYPIIDQSITEYGSSRMTSLTPYLMDMYTNFSFVSNESTTINSMNAYISVFEGEYNGTQSIKQKLIFVEKDSLVFDLIYSASKDLYDEYLTVVDQGIETFTIQ